MDRQSHRPSVKHVGLSLRERRENKSRSVQFADSVNISFCSEESDWSFDITHRDLECWHDKPWRMPEVHKTTPPHNTFRIIGECEIPDIPGRPPEATIEGFRVQQPTPGTMPLWVHEGWERFVVRARRRRRHEGPTIYCRTWFIHHDEVREWQHWREFRLDQEFHEWQPRLQELWIDQLRDSEVEIRWVVPAVPDIPGWEGHAGDIILAQGANHECKAILSRTTSVLAQFKNLTLNAFSVPNIQPRHDLLMKNRLMITCWTNECTISRGTRILRDGIIQHDDFSGLHILVTPNAATSTNRQIEDLLTHKHHEATCDGPLSSEAVLNTRFAASDGEVSFLRPQWISCKALHPDRHHTDELAEDDMHVTDETDGEDPDMQDTNSTNGEDENGDDEPYFPPEDPTDGTVEDVLQSALLYEIGKPEQHAHLRWTSPAALYRSAAEAIGVPLNRLYELHDMLWRPEEIAPDACPMIVHKHGDVPIGSAQKIVLLDVNVYDEHAPTTTDRRTLLLDALHTRSQVLQLARLDRYCEEMQQRCIVKRNGSLWPLQDTLPRAMAHGVYIQIYVPPTQRREMLTAQAIWCAQTGRRVPDIEEAFSLHHRPGLAAEMEAEDEVYQEDDAISVATPPVETIHDDLMDPDEHFIHDLQDIWEDEAIAEDEDEGEVAYFATWYLSGHNMHRCHRSRHIALRDDHDFQWLRQLASVWQDYVDTQSPLRFFVVNPDPPASIMERNIAGHIILAQHLRPHQRATHMTVIRADHPEQFHLAWAMITSTRVNKPLLFGWHLVDAVCPPMMMRNVCTRRTGDREIRDGDELDVHHGASYVTTVERAALPTTSAWALRVSSSHDVSREQDSSDPHAAPSTSQSEGGNYFGVAEFRPSAAAAPQTLSLADLLDMQETTCIAHIVEGVGLQGLPAHVELPRWYTTGHVQEELLCWGHFVNVYRFGMHDKVLCLPVTFAEQGDLWHYMYCNIDTNDVDGAFLHSDNQLLSVHEHMKILHQLGYQRAAIATVTQLTPDHIQVLFEEVKADLETSRRPIRESTGWPPRQPIVEHAAIFTDRFETLPDNCTNFRLRMSRTLHDLRDLLTSGQACLSRDLSHLELPESIRQALEQCEPSRDVNDIDRLLIYTDGSSQSKSRREAPDRTDDLQTLRDTWAFVVLGERYGTDDGPNKLFFIGWQAHPVLYDQSQSHCVGSTRAGSEVAEREALFWAQMWRIGQNCHVPTCFRPDNSMALGQAQGHFGTQDLDTTFRALRGTGQALEAMLGRSGQSHTGEVWNELVDMLAKEEAKKSQYGPRQPLDLRLWLDDLPYLWTYFSDHDGLPPLTQQGHQPFPPSAPPEARIQDATTVTQGRKKIDFTLSMASGNVASLYHGPDGHRGKLDYLREQMKEHAINVIGIQEARTPQGMSSVNHVLRISGGSQTHLYGVELWVNLAQPFAYIHRQPVYFQRNDFVVVRTHPRYLIVHAVNKIFDAWLVVAHAPQSGRPREEREQWWQQFTEVVQGVIDGAPLFLLIDANASSGFRDGVQVGVHDAPPTVNTPLFRDLLVTFDLCLPATMEVQCGEQATWTAPDGSYSRRIDYVAIPAAWSWTCSRAEVVQSFDLGQEHDHSLTATAVELQWTTHDVILSKTTKTHKHVQVDHAATRLLPVDLLQNFPTPGWSHDIGSHVHAFNDEVHRRVREAQPRAEVAAKKPYVTAEIWRMRKDKLSSKKTLKRQMHSRQTEIAAVIFQQWRQCVARQPMQMTQDSPAACQSAENGLCRLVKSAAQLLHSSRALRIALRQAKAEALQSCVAALPHGCSASSILRELRPHIGPSNPAKAKKMALPMVKQLDGRVCTTPQESLDRWIEHFMTMEGGQRVDFDTQYQTWRQHILDLEATSLDLHWTQLPSLTDVEHACRHVAIGKATGPDGITSTLVHTYAKDFAKQLYCQLLKLALHGAEALIHKGGRLAVAYKHKGPQNVCESFRSLLVSSHIGKVLHKALRSHQCQIFESFLQREQLGGRRKVPVQLALHITRTFLRVNQRRGRSTASFLSRAWHCC